MNEYVWNIGGVSATVEISTFSVRSLSQQRLAHKMVSMAADWRLATGDWPSETPQERIILKCTLQQCIMDTAGSRCFQSQAVLRLYNRHAKRPTVFCPRYINCVLSTVYQLCSVHGISTLFCPRYINSVLSTVYQLHKRVRENGRFIRFLPLLKYLFFLQELKTPPLAPPVNAVVTAAEMYRTLDWKRSGV
jgi:hypothetical protein